MAAKRKSSAPQPVGLNGQERAAGETEEGGWSRPGAPEVLYDREQDRERVLGASRRWEREEDKDQEEDGIEDEEGPEGYHCQICGYHADQLQPFNLHLHTVHPAVVLQELYGLLGLPASLVPGLLGAPVPGLGVTISPRPILSPNHVRGPIPGRGPEHIWGLLSRLGPTGGLHPGLGLTGGPIAGLGLTEESHLSLGVTGGPHPSLGLRGRPIAGYGLTKDPQPSLRLTGDLYPSLELTGGPTKGPHPNLSRGTTSGLGQTAHMLLGQPEGHSPRAEGECGGRESAIVQIDLTGEDEAEAGGEAESGPRAAASPEKAAPIPSAVTVEGTSSSSQCKLPEPTTEPDPDNELELEASGPLAESFSRFPYPSPAELARCGLSAGLPAERVRVWFAVQRLRHGISWTPEEVWEARDKLQQGRSPLRLPLPTMVPGSKCVPGPCGLKGQAHPAGLRSGSSPGHLPLEQTECWNSKARDSPGGEAGPESKPLLQQDGEEEEEGEMDEEEGPQEAAPRLASPRLQPPLLGRPRKSKEQLAVLKGFFLRCRWPSADDYSRLVQSTGLARADIIQWFGDTRYALKNGQLKWVHRGSAALAGVRGGGSRAGGGGCPRRGEMTRGPQEAGSEKERLEGEEEKVVGKRGLNQEISGHGNPVVRLVL
ncbi:uncharacterized protein [Mobula birostris]|uniref:uncharacterized protein n=1 Tax=Mobula birostris TaxID=1983395 RepID=UPI003B2840C8